jgi:hypothetical protein
MNENQVRQIVQQMLSADNVNKLYNTKNVAFHQHNGIDSPKLATPVAPTISFTVAPVSGSFNVSYTNTSGVAQLHLVSIYFQVPNTGSSAVATFKVAGSGVAEISLQNPVSSNSITSELMLVALVPAGSTYEIVNTLTGTGYAQLIYWNAVNF